MLPARLERRPIGWSVLKEKQDPQEGPLIVAAEEADKNDPVVRMDTKIGVICGNRTCHEPLGHIDVAAEPVPPGLAWYSGSHELLAHFQPRYSFVPRKYDEEGRTVDPYDRGRKRQLGKQARNNAGRES